MDWAYWERGGRGETGSAAAYFTFLSEAGHVVSLVGGGGKSTLMAHLAACFCRNGLRTAAMTTTKIARPAHPCATMADCRAAWAAGQVAACGAADVQGKFRAPALDVLGALLREAQAVVVEADGAHRLPCKAPAAHEPVILPETDIVVGVMGLDALGQPVEKACHRPEYVQALLGCAEDHRLTAQDMADILLSAQGTRKGVGARAYHVVLNKCDDAQRLEAGRQVLAALRARGHTRAVLTRFL